jgi:hypothetical protein
VAGGRDGSSSRPPSASAACRARAAAAYARRARARHDPAPRRHCFTSRRRRPIFEDPRGARTTHRPEPSRAPRDSRAPARHAALMSRPPT